MKDVAQAQPCVSPKTTIQRVIEMGSVTTFSKWQERLAIYLYRQLSNSLDM